MSDTGGFPLVGGSPAFPGKNNVVRDGSGSNSFGWENLNVGNLSVVGGYRNKVSSSQSFVTGGTSNSVTGGSTTLIVGNLNTITGSLALCVGQSCGVSGSGAAIGSTNTLSGSSSFVSGLSNTVSGDYSGSIGRNSAATKSHSIAIGMNCGATRYGEFAHGGYGVNIYTACQRGCLMFGNQSTSATPVILYLDGIAATERAVLAAGARWKCTLEIIAATTGAIDKSASWEYKFQIDRPTTAATTIIRTTPLLTLSDGSNAGAPPAGWSVAITADTTNGCPQIQVTGDTDTINWTAALHYVQSIRV